MATSCKSNYICHKCKGRHHISICTFSKNENPPQNITTQTQGDGTGSISTNLSTNKNSILLQTALATITSPSEELQVETRLLFDSGSQRTYISEHLRKELKLPTIRQEKILIKTFGQTDFSAKLVDIVVVKIKKGNVARFVEAICMSVICSDLLNQNTAVACENYAHLRELELADFSINSVKSVDLLIGLDFYYSFITGESIRGKANEPIATKSILGWLICGTFENSHDVLTNLNVTHMHPCICIVLIKRKYQRSKYVRPTIPCSMILIIKGRKNKIIMN